MATVSDILAEKKDDHLYTVDSAANVLDATRMMNQYKVGALVITEAGCIAGIFTERDVLRRVVGEQRNPADVTVGQVMTRDVICVEPETDLDEVSAIMKTRRIRHVPVCAEGKVLGLVSIGDVNAHYASNQAQTIHFLSEYVYGRC
jgi:CBS domain-containing protein